MQLTFEGKTLDELAIELIQAYEPPEGYYLGFSGGKDSVVIEHLTRRAGVKYRAVYNVSPIDPEFIRHFIKLEYPDVEWEYHARGFWNKPFMSHGLPTRKRRWCCELIKEAGGAGEVKILGMRKAESNTRKQYNCFTIPRNTDKAKGWVLPILNWSDTDVWQYIAEHNIHFCSAYRHGFNRIGCVLCPFLTAPQTKWQMKLFPEITKLWRLAADRYFDIRIERGTPLPFKTKDEQWNWWISRESAKKEKENVLSI